MCSIKTLLTLISFIKKNDFILCIRVFCLHVCFMYPVCAWYLTGRGKACFKSSGEAETDLWGLLAC